MFTVTVHVLLVLFLHLRYSSPFGSGVSSSLMMMSLDVSSDVEPATSAAVEMGIVSAQSALVLFSVPCLQSGGTVFIVALSHSRTSIQASTGSGPPLSVSCGPANLDLEAAGSLLSLLGCAPSVPALLSAFSLEPCSYPWKGPRDLVWNAGCDAQRRQCHGEDGARNGAGTLHPDETLRDISCVFQKTDAKEVNATMGSAMAK